MPTVRLTCGPTPPSTRGAQTPEARDVLNQLPATTRAIWAAIKHADQYGRPDIADALFEILERRMQASMGPAGGRASRRRAND